MGKDALGELEVMVLLAVLRRPDDAYAVTVRREISDRAGRDVSRGSVYVTLDRLEKKGLLVSRVGEPEPVRGGKAKKFYAPTDEGRATLTRSLVALREMSSGLGLADEVG